MERSQWPKVVDYFGKIAPLQSFKRAVNMCSQREIATQQKSKIGLSVRNFEREI